MTTAREPSAGQTFLCPRRCCSGSRWSGQTLGRTWTRSASTLPRPSRRAGVHLPRAGMGGGQLTFRLPSPRSTSKRGGALEFVTKSHAVTNQRRRGDRRPRRSLSSDTGAEPMTAGVLAARGRPVLASEPLPPISRLTLALYCGASGDHNPLHVDIDAARAGRHDDVIAHGMLSDGLPRKVPDRALRPIALSRSSPVRFVAMTRVGDRLTCRGEVT